MCTPVAASVAEEACGFGIAVHRPAGAARAVRRNAICAAALGMAASIALDNAKEPCKGSVTGAGTAYAVSFIGSCTICNGAVGKGAALIHGGVAEETSGRGLAVGCAAGATGAVGQQTARPSARSKASARVFRGTAEQPGEIRLAVACTTGAVSSISH